MIAEKLNKLNRSLHKPKAKAITGLDIDASSVAASEVQVNGSVRVNRYGIAGLGAGWVRDGEVHEPAELAAVLKDMFAARELPKDVRVGIANQKVAVRTLRLPQIEKEADLDAAIRFAADEHIPMPLESAVLDWQVIPTPELDEIRQMQVVVVAARREMLDSLLEAVRRAGLRPVGIDHSAFALIRALAGKSSGHQVAEPSTTLVAGEVGAVAPGQLYCHLGDITNLAVARGSYCLFSRVLGYGVEGIAQTLAGSSELTMEHARQWLIHVGVDQPIEQIEGDPRTVELTRSALVSGVATLGDELRRSLEFYAASEDAVSLDAIVVGGPGTTIPGFVEGLQGELPLPTSAAMPTALASAVGPAAGRLTLSFGLGVEE